MPTQDELRILQALPLELKVARTKQRIREWVRYFGEDDVSVSFSGGKDSTVLLHIVRQLYPNIKAYFVNTGLEYPEIQKFAKSFDNVEVLRPGMQFSEVISKYGYPFISKEVSQTIYYSKQFIKRNGFYRGNRVTKDDVIDMLIHSTEKNVKITNDIQSIIGNRNANAHARMLTGEYMNNDGAKSRFNKDKWFDLINLDFSISNVCCSRMKEKPLDSIKSKSIIATMADESDRRLQGWLKTGCNAFESKKQISKPMSFWTEQDVLKYIKANNIQIASVYGDIVYKGKDGNYYEDDLAGDCELCTTGCDRTGCIFCGFGAHLDKKCGGESRFVRLKRTHPRQYEYCMGGGAYDPEDGLWKPTKEGLGMAHCIDELNKLYSKNGKPFIEY